MFPVAVAAPLTVNGPNNTVGPVEVVVPLTTKLAVVNVPVIVSFKNVGEESVSRF